MLRAMTQIKVRFFTVLREITGKKEETVMTEEQKITLQSILNLLSKKYGPPFRNYIYDSRTNNVKSFLQFLVNGKSAKTIQGLQTQIKDGDVLAIIPPVGGG